MDEFDRTGSTEIQADEPIPLRRVQELTTPFFNAGVQRDCHGLYPVRRWRDFLDDSSDWTNHASRLFYAVDRIRSRLWGELRRFLELTLMGCDRSGQEIQHPSVLGSATGDHAQNPLNESAAALTVGTVACLAPAEEGSRDRVTGDG
jgi:hypothetical protein